MVGVGRRVSWLFWDPGPWLLLDTCGVLRKDGKHLALLISILKPSGLKGSPSPSRIVVVVEISCGRDRGSGRGRGRSGVKLGCILARRHGFG